MSFHLRGDDSRGHNPLVQSGSPIPHAEMDALDRVGRKSAAFCRECTLYTTRSPCVMCSGAIVLCKIPRVVIGENSSFMGEEQWLAGHDVQLEVRYDAERLALMREFIGAASHALGGRHRQVT